MSSKFSSKCTFSNKLYRDILAARDEIQGMLRSADQQRQQRLNHQSLSKNKARRGRGRRFRPAQRTTSIHSSSLTLKDQIYLAFVSDVNVLVDRYQQQQDTAKKTQIQTSPSANHFYNHLFLQIFYKYMLKGEMGTKVVDISDDLYARLNRHYACLTGQMKESTTENCQNNNSMTNKSLPSSKAKTVKVITSKSRNDVATIWC